MAITTGTFRLSPNLLDRFRDGLARESYFASDAAILDSCGYKPDIHSIDNQSFDLLAGFNFGDDPGEKKFISGTENFQDAGWLFGHFCYELKDSIEKGLVSTRRGTSGFSPESFFTAGLVCCLRGEELQIHSWLEEKPEKIFNRLMDSRVTAFNNQPLDLNVEYFPRKSYLDALGLIRYHLQRGDIYELNYCIPFRLNYPGLDIVSTWRALNKTNPAPFSALYKRADSWLLCSSPERFLRKEGERIFSQPIKGTIRRSADLDEDSRLGNELLQSEKERAENIMITDLVRNDLSKIARRGSVKVEELCGLYSFRNVYQLISTISAQLRENISMGEIIRATFPMGSMTGAPKHRAMQIIEELEDFRREIFSGSIGYITPEKNFDLNVVIRSIIYNNATGDIMIPAGSAITAKSDPEKEYEECLLKAEALLQLFKSPVSA
jgi:para-aminobenzoate synthetase component 1